MYVAEDVRGRGGAELLCDACARWTADRGLSRLVLAVYASNARALRAYEKCGFSLDPADDDGAELRHMRRTVT